MCIPNERKVCNLFLEATRNKQHHATTSKQILPINEPDCIALTLLHQVLPRYLEDPGGYNPSDLSELKPLRLSGMPAPECNWWKGLAV